MSALDQPKILAITPVTNDPTKPSKLHSAVTAIKKVKSYFTINSFSIAGLLWYDVPRLVGQINFSIIHGKFTVDLPLNYDNDDFILCIKYRKFDLVYRYKLWDKNNYLPIFPFYTGQRIYKNFVIEVWQIKDKDTIGLVNDLIYQISPVYFPNPINSITPINELEYRSNLITDLHVDFPLGTILNYNVSWLTNTYGGSSSLLSSRHNLNTLIDFI